MMGEAVCGWGEWAYGKSLYLLSSGCLALKIAQLKINSIENNYCSIKPEKLIVYKSANPNENFSDYAPLDNEANLTYFMMYIKIRIKSTRIWKNIIRFN